MLRIIRRSAAWSSLLLVGPQAGPGRGLQLAKRRARPLRARRPVPAEPGGGRRQRDEDGTTTGKARRCNPADPSRTRAPEPRSYAVRRADFRGSPAQALRVLFQHSVPGDCYVETHKTNRVLSAGLWSQAVALVLPGMALHGSAILAGRVLFYGKVFTPASTCSLSPSSPWAESWACGGTFVGE